jgi:histidyl-tRNA synthetase
MITALRGFRDIWGEDCEVFEEIISTFKNRLRDFNVVWIETPILEPLELFIRSVGEFTDIVQKQMFSFRDRGNREVALRPEGTAGVVRAFVENRLSYPIRLAYFGPCSGRRGPRRVGIGNFTKLGLSS